MQKKFRPLFSHKITKRGFMRMVALAGPLLPTLSLLSSKSHAQAGLSQVRILQGPMLGAVTPTSIRIWVRVGDEFPVSVAVSESPRLGDAVVTPPVLARAEDDLAVTVLVNGLRPATRYYYRVLVDGSRGKYTPDVPVYSFVTAPDPKSAAAFSVAIGSCARYPEDPDQVIWRSVAAANPDFFIWLGDNIYGDSGQPSTLNGEYQRQRDVITYQPVARQIPQIAIWDDHDSGINNGDGSSPFKDAALQSFRNYWANPAYGLHDTPGVFFDYHYGGIDFFLLDGRYYRDPNEAPDDAGKTMLGAAQKAWLKDRLRASKAPFKVIVSGGGWTINKGPGGDSWASFLAERNELFDFIRDKRISGVVLVSGETHIATQCHSLVRKGRLRHVRSGVLAAGARYVRRVSRTPTRGAHSPGVFRQRQFRIAALRRARQGSLARIQRHELSRRRGVGAAPAIRIGTRQRQGNLARQNGRAFSDPLRKRKERRRVLSAVTGFPSAA
jgi:alkaline phosphatase D